MTTSRRLLAAGLLTGALLAGTGPAAHADCVDATVRYEVLDGGENTVVDGCVAPTPLNNQAGHLGPTELGAPWAVWVYVDLWFPLP